MEFSPGIERVRQQAIALKNYSKECKKKTPKGKVYKGLRFKWFSENGSCGFRPIPVYEKKVSP